MAVAPATYRVGESYEQQRLSSHKRGYTKAWQRARKSYLAAHALCVECERQGIVTAANEVDHVVPHRGSWVLFWDATNWSALCKACHTKKTMAGL